MACASDFASAVPLPLDGPSLQSAFPDVATSVCYFKFDASGPSFVNLFGYGNPSDPSFIVRDPAYPDLWVTLYDANQQQVARNSTSHLNNRRLLTHVTAAGTYYVTVSSCYAATQASYCNVPAQVTHDVFQVEAVTAAPAGVEAPEPNNTFGTAGTVNVTSDGGSFAIEGLFQTPGDADAYLMTFPTAEQLPSNTRAWFEFFPAVGGVNYNGSTSPVGVMSLVDLDDPTHAVAQFDATGVFPPQLMLVPVTPGRPYLFRVADSSSDAGTNDFYVVTSGAIASDPLASTTSGSAPDGSDAEILFPDANLTGALSGDLSNSAVHWFTLGVPGNLPSDSFSVYCNAQSLGSGLRGFTIDVYGPDKVTSLGSAVEDPIQGDWVNVTPVSSQGQVFVRLSATSQDPNVTGSFYDCYYQFQ